MIKKDSLQAFTCHNNSVLECGEDFVYCLPCRELRPFISNYTITFPTKELKAAIRKKEKFDIGQEVKITIVV